MNTPIEKIREIKKITSIGYYGDWVDGFRACEKRYQELWQEFIDTYEFPRTMAKSLYEDFQKWLEDRQNGK